MSVQNLTQAQLDAALRQIVSAPGFAAQNPHLTAAQRAAIAGGAWPQEPVFSPYASTHHGYSQIRISGTKYLTHRVTYQQFVGVARPLAGLDISHLLYMGKATSRNINPRHLTAEPNIINQTRKMCALFWEEMLWRWSVGLARGHDWSEARFVAEVVSINVACATVHAANPCSCAPRFWEELDSIDDLGQF